MVKLRIPALSKVGADTKNRKPLGVGVPDFPSRAVINLSAVKQGDNAGTAINGVAACLKDKGDRPGASGFDLV